MNPLKKAGRFLCSMKCAMILLVILALACTAGSMIPQQKVMSYYTDAYPQWAAGAIMLFGLHDVFHCRWFLGLTLFLCVNLVFCNIRHFPQLKRRMKAGFSLEACLKDNKRESLCQVENAKTLFQKMGFSKPEESNVEGTVCLYGVRNKAGIWGAWLCHLGMLIIIAGFGLGQMFQTEYTVYGVKGQTKTVGDSGYELTIDDFEIRLRDDDTVEQYEASVTVTDPVTGEKRSGKTSVNAPVSLFGMKYYQNSTGWAAKVSVWKDDEEIQDDLLCVGEYVKTKEKEDLVLMLRAFYPDYARDDLGNPMTVSSALHHPAYLYALYYQDQMLGMNLLEEGEEITVDNYTFRFHDPQPYTLIQAKKDPFTCLAALGGLFVVTALILAFYIRPEEMWAMKNEDGSWSVFGRSKKGGSMFEEKIFEKSEEIKWKERKNL